MATFTEILALRDKILKLNEETDIVKKKKLLKEFKKEFHAIFFTTKRKKKKEHVEEHVFASIHDFERMPMHPDNFNF